MPLQKNPLTAQSADSHITHNTALNKMIDGINIHSHDPNQALDTASAGGFITQFGSADPRYGTIGPGSPAWNTLGTQVNLAAIPADPTEAAIDPITGLIMNSGTASAYSGITYGHGQGIELARIRGVLAKLTGNKWYSPTGAAVQFSTGGSGRDLTVGALTATTGSFSPAANIAPFTINLTSGQPPVVQNLNAQLVNGFTASAVAGTANAILASNAQGLYGPSSIAADTIEAAILNTSLTNTNIITDNLNNIRFMLQQWAIAAYGSSGKWNSMATTPPPLVSSIIASGANLTGQVSMISGVGISVSQSGPNTVRFDAIGPGPITDAPVLTAPDLINDTIISGSLQVSNTALNISVNGGMQGYVMGYRAQAASSGYTLGPYTVVASSSGPQPNYLWWNGGSSQNSFQITQTSTAPTGGWMLAASGTLMQNATNANQTTVPWNLNANLKPSVTGSKGGNAALASLMTALNKIGIVVDNTT